MKKTFFTISALSLLAFASCSDDDKKIPEPAAPTVQQFITGKWSAVYFASDKNNNKLLDESEKEYVTHPHDEVMLELKTDGSGTCTYFKDTATMFTTEPLIYQLIENDKKIVLGYNAKSDTFSILSLGNKDLAIFSHIKEDTTQTDQWITYKKIN